MAAFMTSFREVQAGTDREPSENETRFADQMLSTPRVWEARSLSPWPATVLGSSADGFRVVHARTKVVRLLDARTLEAATIEAISLGVMTPGGLDALLASTSSVPRQNRVGHVYFIAGDTGPIKIGFAQDYQRRLAGLQIGSPLVLSILATVVGSEDDERAYHQMFAGHRLHGEWFNRCPEILAEIERLTAHKHSEAP